MIESFVNAFFVFWIGLCLVSWTVQYKLYALMEQYHYEKWVWLGKPKFPTMYSTVDKSNPFSAMTGMFRIAFRVMGLPLRSNAELSSDPRVKSLWQIHRVVTYIALISFVMFLATAVTVEVRGIPSSRSSESVLFR